MELPIDGVGHIATTGPAETDASPPFPYTGCKAVTVKLSALWSGYPSSPFLQQFTGAGTDLNARAYYKVIDPRNLRTTLAAWWSVNGFDTTGSAPAGPNYARTSFLNNNDLGSGHDMHFLRHANGTLSAYVTNYSRGGEFNQNPVFADDALAQSDRGATVCMEFSPVEGDPTSTKIVKFFVFQPGSGARTTSAVLDEQAFGPKFVPNLCLNCHGGSFNPPANPGNLTLADVNMGSSFRELDVSTYKFPGGRTVPNATEQAAFKEQNQLILSTASGRKPILDLITNWYLPSGTGLVQDNSYTPTNWLGAPQQTLYQDVVKISCRTCHIAFQSDDNSTGIDWNRYDQFVANRFTISAFAVGTSISAPSSRLMPHSLVTYRNFWLDNGQIGPIETQPIFLEGFIPRPRELWQYSDPPRWTPIGAPGP